MINLHAVHRSGQSQRSDLRRFLVVFAHRFLGGDELPAICPRLRLQRRETAESCPHRLELHQNNGGKQLAVESPGNLVEFAVEDARDLRGIFQILRRFVPTVFL